MRLLWINVEVDLSGTEEGFKSGRLETVSKNGQFSFERIAFQQANPMGRCWIGYDILQEASVTVIVRAAEEYMTAVAIVEIQFEDLCITPAQLGILKAKDTLSSRTHQILCRLHDPFHSQHQ